MPQPSLTSRLTRFVVLAMAASGLIAVLVAFLGEWNWFADLFCQLRPQYCIWLAVALAGAAMCRHTVAALLAVTGLIANAVALAPYAWRPIEKTPPAAGRKWTFATINLLHGNREVARVVGYLREARPDIVVFQEVSPRWAGELEQLSDLFPHRAVRAAKDNFGIALFSRDRPLQSDIRVVGNRPGDFAVFASWQSGERTFSLAGVHPDKPDDEWKTVNRSLYLGHIAEWCEEKARANEPVIVLGDFNATPWSKSLRDFRHRTQLANAHQGTLFKATWNVWQPQRLLIDHAFVSRQWVAEPCEIGGDVGSDHRPVLVRAALESAKSP